MSPRGRHTPSTSTYPPTQKLFEPCPLGCYGDFVTSTWLITSLTISDWTQSSPSPLPEEWGEGTEILTFYSRLVPVATSPLPLLRCFPKSHYECKPHWGRKGLVWGTRYPIHLYVSEAISGTEDKKPNIIAKDAPVACIAQKFQEVWETWARNCAIRPNIYDKYILVI